MATAISSAWAHHIAAARDKDPEAVLALYAEDVVYEVRSSDGAPGSGEVRGLDALTPIEQGALQQADVLDVRHTTRDLRVHGEAAYELGTVQGGVRPRGGEAAFVTFQFMALWERQPDGGWKILHLVGRME